MELSPSAEEPRRETPPGGPVRRALRVALLGTTLFFVIAALVISSALVVYTAWLHQLGNGLFALLFAILSAQIALNWLLWKDDEDDPEEA
jgi:hypothetical protein